MPNTSFHISLIIILLLTSCSLAEKEANPEFTDYDMNTVPYKLFAPDKSQTLHWDLEEISGLSYYESNKLLAIEDETGRLYILDATTMEVLEKIKFEKGGDYEGVEYHDGKVWVMESSGKFYSFTIEGDKAINVKFMKSEFSSKNDLEGLAIRNGTLIVATKGEGSINGVDKKGKGIYEINDSSSVPLFFIQPQHLNAFIKNRNHFNRIKDFDPSGLAIHPKTEDFYILSADHVLVIYNKELELKEIVKLDKRIFTQPEGICFSPEGVMYISSEGDGERGELFEIKPLTVKK